MKDVKQVNTKADEEVVVTMDLKRSSFLVKNFTDKEIQVYLGDNPNYSLIGPNSWERLFNNVDDRVSSSAAATNKVRIVAKEVGVVEVASIDY